MLSVYLKLLKLIWFVLLLFLHVPLGVIFKDENVNEDMLATLWKFHLHLPQMANSQVDGQIFTGDQLTVKRAVNMIASVANGFTARHTLKASNFRLETDMQLLSFSW